MRCLVSFPLSQNMCSQKRQNDERDAVLESHSHHPRTPLFPSLLFPGTGDTKHFVQDRISSPLSTLLAFLQPLLSALQCRLPKWKRPPFPLRTSKHSFASRLYPLIKMAKKKIYYCAGHGAMHRPPNGSPTHVLNPTNLEHQARILNTKRLLLTHRNTNSVSVKA